MSDGGYQMSKIREPLFLKADGKSADIRHPKPGTHPKGGESKHSADKSRGMRRRTKERSGEAENGGNGEKA